MKSLRGYFIFMNPFTILIDRYSHKTDAIVIEILNSDNAKLIYEDEYQFLVYFDDKLVSFWNSSRWHGWSGDWNIVRDKTLVDTIVNAIVNGECKTATSKIALPGPLGGHSGRPSRLNLARLYGWVVKQKESRGKSM